MAIAVAFVGTPLQLAQAQDVPVPPTVDRPAYRADARNPFAPTRRILERRDRGGGGVGFTRADGDFKFPKMKLRGMVSGDAELVALLEIDGEGIHVVREGDTIGLYESDDVQVLRVRRINRLNLEVEGGSLNQVIIVR